jgi:hypothetical protein
MVGIVQCVAFGGGMVLLIAAGLEAPSWALNLGGGFWLLRLVTRLGEKRGCGDDHP